MSKQDRQGVRKASDIEQKYDLSKLNDLTGNAGRQNEQISKLTQSLSQFSVEVSNKIIEVRKQIEEMSHKIQPIGSVYIGVDEFEPDELFGGTWDLIAVGKLVVGSSAGDDGLLQTDDTCYIWARTD